MTTAQDITRLIAECDREMMAVGCELCPDCLREAAMRARATAVTSFQNMILDGHAVEDAANYCVRMSARLAAEATHAENHHGAEPTAAEVAALVARVSAEVRRELWGRPQ